jgi:uncharacterized protein (TIGR02217 family)
MQHLDAYLDRTPAYGWEGTPRWSTLITALQNGDEYRNAEWIEARHEFVAPFQNISKEAYRQIRRMHSACRGMLYAFRFRDQLDFEAENEQFGVGTGGVAEFQLNKVSEVDGVEYVRNVYAIALGTVPTITVNGTPTTAFTVNLRTGKVLFDSPPALDAVLRWSGTFDIWVRFATDTIPFSLDNPNATNGQVSVIEVPAPEEGFSS